MSEDTNQARWPNATRVRDVRQAIASPCAVSACPALEVSHLESEPVCRIVHCEHAQAQEKAPEN